MSSVQVSVVWSLLVAFALAAVLWLAIRACLASLGSAAVSASGGGGAGSRLLSVTSAAYECGFSGRRGAADRRLNLQFWMVGVVLVLFDVEVGLLVPAIFASGESYVAVLVFIGLLFYGLLLDAGQGVLDWRRS